MSNSSSRKINNLGELKKVIFPMLEEIIVLKKKYHILLKKNNFEKYKAETQKLMKDSRLVKRKIREIEREYKKTIDNSYMVDSLYDDWEHKGKFPKL